MPGTENRMVAISLVCQWQKTSPFHCQVS